jgi:protein SCO1/2
MNRRLAIWLTVGIGAALVIAIVLLLTQLGSTLASQAADQQALQRAYQEGTNLGGAPAPAFTLPDQTGATVSIGQLRGHPVVLTFFDSVCPHADCSLMAEYLNWTARGLGPQAGQVNWAAISVDPWHDTPAAASTFLAVHQVTMRFHYLLGTPGQLAPVWQAYHVQAILQPDNVVIHTTGVYVLDAQGRERLFLDEGFDPKILSGYLQALLHERAAAPAPRQTATTSHTSGAVAQAQVVAGYTIALTAMPGQFGTYSFTVAIQDAQGAPLQGATLEMALTMPAMQMSALHVQLAPITPPVPGAYQAQGVLSMKGEWQAVVLVYPSGAAPLVQATFRFTAIY